MTFTGGVVTRVTEEVSFDPSEPMLASGAELLAGLSPAERHALLQADPLPERAPAAEPTPALGACDASAGCDKTDDTESEDVAFGQHTFRAAHAGVRKKKGRRPAGRAAIGGGGAVRTAAASRPSVDVARLSFGGEEDEQG